MNRKTLIVVVLLFLIAFALIVLAFVSSSKKTLSVSALFAAKAKLTTDLPAVFEGFLYDFAKNSEDFYLSDTHPYRDKGSAKLILVKISEQTQKPELYKGARIFVHGVYKLKLDIIEAKKIEASCPSKEQERLEASQD